MGANHLQFFYTYHIYYFISSYFFLTLYGIELKIVGPK